MEAANHVLCTTGRFLGRSVDFKLAKMMSTELTMDIARNVLIIRDQVTLADFALTTASVKTPSSIQKEIASSVRSISES